MREMRCSFAVSYYRSKGWPMSRKKKRRRLAGQPRLISSCADCPCLYQNGEYPESICRLADRNWGMGYYEGGPPPDWCPLRNSATTLALNIGAAW